MVDLLFCHAILLVSCLLLFQTLPRPLLDRPLHPKVFPDLLQLVQLRSQLLDLVLDGRPAVLPRDLVTRDLGATDHRVPMVVERAASLLVLWHGGVPQDVKVPDLLCNVLDQVVHLLDLLPGKAFQQSFHLSARLTKGKVTKISDARLDIAHTSPPPLDHVLGAWQGLQKPRSQPLQVAQLEVLLQELLLHADFTLLKCPVLPTKHLSWLTMTGSLPLLAWTTPCYPSEAIFLLAAHPPLAFFAGSSVSLLSTLDLQSFPLSQLIFSEDCQTSSLDWRLLKHLVVDGHHGVPLEGHLAPL